MKRSSDKGTASGKVSARALVVGITIAGLLSLTSCIYDAPNDRFYRTLWVSDEAPFSTDAGSIDDSPAATSDSNTFRGLTIEFLCCNSIRIHATGAVGSYGQYDPQGMTAYFTGLNLTYYHNGTPIIIVFEEAHRTDDIMLISWHFSGSATSYSTRLVRKNTYL